jgi:hypothetical protein
MGNARSWLLVASLLALACSKAKHDEQPSGPSSKASAVTKETDTVTAKKPRAGKKKKKASDEGKKALPKPSHHDPDAPSAGCGEVVVDGSAVQLECDEDVKVGDNDGIDVVSREAIDANPKSAGGMPLPKLVDHREDGTEGPLRSQGHAGACTCFALAAAIDHALIRREDKPYQVSSLHLWARYHHRAGTGPIHANFDRPITSEASWPYDQALACEWESKKDCTGCQVAGKHHDCKQPVDPKLLEAADGKPYARILHVTRINQPTATQLQQILARGQDVLFGMKINRAAFSEAKGGQHVIGDFDPDKAAGGHVMVLSGYRVQDGEIYFLMHNSWGEKFGDHGFAWLHESTLKKLKVAHVVEAVPSDSAIVGANPPMMPGASCSGGHVPDSATEKCAPVCPDGSPRYDDHCAETDCDAGEVNLHGTCVASAPTHKGTVTATKVDFDCRPSGCVYTLPKGQASCEHDRCMFACPAPRFLLAHEKNGVFCTE